MRVKRYKLLFRLWYFKRLEIKKNIGGLVTVYIIGGWVSQANTFNSINFIP